jgi:hypothetical protein
VNSGDKPAQTRAPAHGPMRRFLRLMVEADSSTRLLGRLRAMMMLAGLLAAFAGLGYGLPALYESYVK